MERRDEELIQSLRQGDTKIMEYLLEKYKPLVKRKARALYLLGGEREDLIQEGMIGLFKAIRDYRPGEMPFAGFAQLCISRQMYTAVETANRKKHGPLNAYVSLYQEPEDDQETPLIDTLPGAWEEEPEAAFFGKATLGDLRSRLRKVLSPLERRVLELHLQGTPYRRIGEILGRSPKTVDNALQRIKRKTQALLEQPGTDERGQGGRS